MAPRHVVVDGSNIATEGRSLPSLAQLDQAVREFLAEHPNDLVTVVVDASFGHRISESELPTFEEAETAGEVVSPPAGAIGRGDAFLLRIAEKTGATVLSNDSFQEFHGEHVWLFDQGRLIGGKPVPGVGWIFTARTPVRGPKSREAVKEAKRRKKADGEELASGLDLAAERAKGKGKGKGKVDRAIARATEEAVEPGTAKRRRRRRSGIPPAEPVNEPLAFITFIAAHPLGSKVKGTVESFSSHGAFVSAEGARCYVPLSAMDDPPPRAAREVFSKGDERSFVVQALDPHRRGIELALPQFAHVSGAPTEETVEAEISPEPELPVPAGRAGKRPSPAAGERATPEKAGPTKARPTKAPAKKAPAKKARAAKAEAAKKAVAKEPPARKAPAKKVEGAKKAVSAKKADAAKTAKKTSAKKTPAKKTGAQTVTAKKTPTKKTPAKKTPAKKAPATGQAAASRQGTAARQATATQAAGGKKAAPAAKKAGPAKKTAAKAPTKPQG